MQTGATLSPGENSAKLKYSPFEKSLEIASIIGLIIHFAFVIMNYSSLPDTIPIHFNLAGEPDGWGHRASIFILPGISLAIYVLITSINLSVREKKAALPDNREKERVRQQLSRLTGNLIKTILIWWLAAVNYEALQVAFGKIDSLHPTTTYLGLIIIFGPLVYMVIKINRAR